MARVAWHFPAWPGAALVRMLGIAAIGRVLAEPGLGAAGGTAGRIDEPLPPEVVASLRGPRLSHSLWMRTALATGIVALMVFKPDLAAGFAVLALAAGVGFGLSLLTQAAGR